MVGSATSSPYRVALLGAGAIAATHATAIRSIAGARLVAVSDVEPFRARRLAELHGAQSYASLDEMLERAKPDVVHVLLPPELHAQFALQCLAAGTHVLVEKPLCISAAECAELEKAAARSKRRVGVNHNVTFQPAFLRLVDAIRERRLGTVEHVSLFWNVPFGLGTFAAPIYARQGPGAVILETGPHPMSVIVRLLGEVRSASTQVTSHARGLPDTWASSLACERGGAQCFIGIGREFIDMRVHVIGQDGCATADLRLGYTAVTENTRLAPRYAAPGDTLEIAKHLAASAGRRFGQYVLRVLERGATDDAANVMRASLTDFYRAVREDREPAASLGEGLAVVRSCLRVIDAGRHAMPVAKEEAACQAAM